MGNPYISLIARGYLWVIIPKNPKVEHYKYHGYTDRGTPNCPLNPSPNAKEIRPYEGIMNHHYPLMRPY